ncbi:type II toxin-antitoxin system PemK/MazF family toxin [Patescibacteria group bacterium]|nr:type II toxin-antitoxin system PemK/MazF family toxin [Patescibacteria group bacterium]
MVKNIYIPKQGDLVWLDFDPAKGHEQKGRRPAFVLSSEKYNKRIGLVLFCPITSVAKNYPFEVLLTDDKIKGVILVDQIKSYDWNKRKLEYITKSNHNITLEVIKKIKTIID